MDELEALLPFFERELALLRRDMRPFAQAFPNAAARLSLTGAQSDDPGVERTIQSAAWFNARISRRIADQNPGFHEALIETAFPTYFSTVPSCAIAQFDVAGLFDDRNQAFTIARGTQLEHRPSLCTFSTAYDVTLAPLSIAHASFGLPSVAPARSSNGLPGDVAGIIHIGIESPTRALTPDSPLFPKSLRVYLHGSPQLAAAIIDAILLRPLPAFVETDRSDAWQPLGKSPASAVGFANAEAIATNKASSAQSALRLLIEYAAFAEKFRFIDFDFAALLRVAGPCDRLTLHLPVAGQAANAAARQQLSDLRADHLRLFCTPVVNRFTLDAEPAQVKQGVHCYAVALPEREGVPAEIETIDSVHTIEGEGAGMRRQEIPPHRAFRHWSPVGAFWQRERDAWVARQTTGAEIAIKLVDLREQPVVPHASKLAIALTCTNGDAPTQLPTGNAEGDLHGETANVEGAIRMLGRPSSSVSPARDDEALLRLVSALTPSNVTLRASSLTELQALLHQFGKSTDYDKTRYISGFQRLQCRRVHQLMQIGPVPTPILVPGFEVTLIINEEAFAGHAIHTLAVLLERYFVRYVGRDSLQLAIVTRSGAERYRGEPQLGPPTLATL
jgi:type VI secretion system protein ImpG